MLDKDYRPEVIDFVLTDAVKESFPKVLFEGAESFESILDTINERFITLFPENETTYRKMDDNEIQDIRDQYCQLQENVVPEKMLKLEQAIETAKRIKRDAEEELNNVMAQIREYAATVKNGTKEMQLSSTKTIRFALMGYYLYYSWVDGALELSKAEKIPEWDLGSLWSQEVKNRTAMKELFGLEFPEIQRPVGSDTDVQDDDDDF